MRKQSLFAVLFILILCACTTKNKTQEKAAANAKPSEVFEVVDSAFFDLVDPDASLEILAEGFVWSEGPVWVEALDALLFSDVPQNAIYKWKESEGVSQYLKPSGYTGNIERGGEPGANGLTLNVNGELILCQHGDRQIAKMNAPLNEPHPDFITLAGNYQGKRFNSPNDVCCDAQNNLYFTDPPYGLINQMQDSAKEIPFQGVYLLKNSGKVVLLTDSLTRPNGIALTPDGKRLIVANSDPKKANWYVYDVKDDGTVENGRIYYSTAAYPTEYNGSPDGLKIDSNGNVFATGPGGIWIFNPSGNFLGIIKTGHATANCAFGKDEKVLFITADNYLMRIKLRS